jgi:hypothetical protein
MPAHHIFKALSLTLVGFLVITALALSVVSLRKEYHSGQPLTGIFSLVLIIITFCVLIALLTASA